MSDEVAWCEIENSGYTGDLALWTGLCNPKPVTRSPAPTFGARTVLELGAGVGRVSVPMHALGVEVWALDSEQELLDEIGRRAKARTTGEIFRICADARSYPSLGRRFDLVIAPHCFLQLFETRADRVAIMQRAANHVAPAGGSSFWMTFHPDLEQAWADEDEDPLPPEVTELEGRTFETYPLDSHWDSHGGERSLRMLWLRRVDGEGSTIERSYADLTQGQLEEEGAEAGLEIVDSIRLPGSDGYLDQLALRFIVGGRVSPSPVPEAR